MLPCGVIEGVIAGAIANLAVDAASAVSDRRQQRQRRQHISEELAPLETEFADALGENIEARAWDLHSDGLREIARNWEPVLDSIDAYDVAFEDEDAGGLVGGAGVRTAHAGLASRVWSVMSPWNNVRYAETEPARNGLRPSQRSCQYRDVPRMLISPHRDRLSDAQYRLEPPH
jgi:hypothetical protein